METLYKDMMGSQSQQSINSIPETLAYASNTIGQSMKTLLLADNFSCSISGQTVPNASSLQFTVQIRQEGLINMHSSGLVGQYWCPTGVVSPSATALFQPLSLTIGEMQQSLSYSNFYNELRQCRKHVDERSNLAQGLKVNMNTAGIPQKYSSYTQGAAAVFYNPVSTNPATALEQLDGYQIIARRLIESHIQDSTGQYITVGGATYALTSFFVPFSALYATFQQEHCPEGFVYSGMSQSIAMTIKFSQYQQCIMQCFDAVAAVVPCQDYGITRMAVLLNYVQLDTRDAARLLSSRIPIQQLSYIPYAITAGLSSTVNLMYSVSSLSAIRKLYIGFFSNMQAVNVLPDSSNTAVNITPSAATAGLMMSQLQSAQLAYHPVPSVLQVTISVNGQTIVLNDQYIQLAHYVDRSDQQQLYKDDRVLAALRNVLCIDLSRYGELDQYGSSSGTSASLIVNLMLGTGQSTGNQFNNNRTIPYQQADWTAVSLQGLQVQSFLEVVNEYSLNQGIYQS